MNKRPPFYFNIIYLKRNDQNTTMNKNKIKRLKQIKWGKKGKFGQTEVYSTGS